MPSTDAAIKELVDALRVVTTELKDRTLGYPTESTNRAIAKAEKLLQKYDERLVQDDTLGSRDRNLQPR